MIVDAELFGDGLQVGVIADDQRDFTAEFARAVAQEQVVETVIGFRHENRDLRDVAVESQNLTSDPGSIVVTAPLFTFFRGDHDGDFRITANDIAIAIDFFDPAPGTLGSDDICEKAMDWDNNGFLEAVDLLSHVNYFSGGLVPFPPSENVALGMPQTSATCGTDTGPDNLSCENVTCP